jgi:hypothetical protein
MVAGEDQNVPVTALVEHVHIPLNRLAGGPVGPGEGVRRAEEKNKPAHTFQLFPVPLDAVNDRVRAALDQNMGLPQAGT